MNFLISFKDWWFWIPTFVGRTVGRVGMTIAGRWGDGGGTFVKVPPHPLKTFGFGESAGLERGVRVGILDSSAIASE